MGIEYIVWGRVERVDYDKGIFEDVSSEPTNLGSFKRCGPAVGHLMRLDCVPEDGKEPMEQIMRRRAADLVRVCRGATNECLQHYQGAVEAICHLVRCDFHDRQNWAKAPTVPEIVEWLNFEVGRRRIRSIKWYAGRLTDLWKKYDDRKDAAEHLK